MFTAAIFDMDGLLIDSERVIRAAWQRACGELGFDLSDALFSQAVGRTEPDTKALFEAVLGPSFCYDGMSARAQIIHAEDLERSYYEIKPGVRELLAELSLRGVPTAVASSTKRNEMETRLMRTGLRPSFRCCLGGDEAARGKPHPDIFLAAATRLGVAPRECLVFEDSEYGARGALAAGMSVVVVPDLKQPPADVRTLALDVLPSLAEALPRIDQWFPRRRAARQT